MPSKTAKQHKFMEAVANNPAFAKKVGIKQSVGKDFAAADKGKKFGIGGRARTDLQKTNKPKTGHGKEALFKEGGEVKHDDIKEDKALIKKAFKIHDKQEHKGQKGTNLTKLCRGGGIESKGKTKGKIV